MVLFRRRSSLTPTKSFSTGDSDWEENLDIPFDDIGAHCSIGEGLSAPRRIEFESDCHQQEIAKKIVVVLEFPPGFTLSDGPPDLLGPNHHPNDPITGWIQDTGSAISTLTPCSCQYYRMSHHSPVCPVAPNLPMARGPRKVVLKAMDGATTAQTRSTMPARVELDIKKTSSTTPTTASSMMSPSQRKNWENRPMLILPETSASNRQERTIHVHTHGVTRQRSNSDNLKIIHRTASQARKVMGFGLGKIRHYEQEQETVEETLDRHTQLDTTCLPISAQSTTADSFRQPKRLSFLRSFSNKNISKNYKFSMPKHELS